ncbi:MAG: hypothetical protein ACOYOA_15450, partial [Saprospiraceae bacterium]
MIIFSPKKMVYPQTLILIFVFFTISFCEAQTNYYSLNGATDFSNTGSWTTDVSGLTSVSPPAALSSSDNFTILSGSSMVLNANASVRQLVVLGSLSVSANVLTIERLSGNQAIMDVNGSAVLNLNGGTIKVKGSVYFSGSSTFNQSSGDLYIDGNSGTLGSSSNPLRALLGLNSSIPINISGGSWTFPDPQGNTSTSSGVQECIYYNNSNHINLPSSHTIRFGDGISVQNGGSVNGFRTNLWAGSGFLRLGSVVFNGVNSATNRYSTHSWTPAINGDLSVLSGEARFTTLCVAGNISVSPGAILTVSTLNMAFTSPGTASGNAMVSVAQFINNNGTIRSAATAIPNLQIANFNIANSSASGVSLNCPLNVGAFAWTSIGGAYKGIVNTTTSNVLKIVGSTGTGVASSVLGTDLTSGVSGDNDAYVKGPLQITFSTGFNNTNYISGFPVGASVFNPLSLSGISAAPTQATTIQVEAFDVNPGMSAAGVSQLPSKRWDLSVVGTNGLPSSGLKLRLSDVSIASTNLVVRSSTPNGTYSSATGSTTFTAAPSGNYSVNSIQTTTNISATSLAGSYTFANLASVPACASLIAPTNAAVLNLTPTLSW